MTYAELKKSAQQRKVELEHFGMPGSFSVDPQVLLDLIADAERLDWLDKQYQCVTDGHTQAQPEGELVSYRWVVDEPAGDIRTAIDMYANGQQP